MSIPAQYVTRYIYHFTHIDNLPSLLRNGFLAKNHPNFPLASSTSIAAASIQERRAAMNVTCGAGGVIHDYVPFYFGSVSPMLLGILNRKNIDQFDILYFEFPISLLMRPGAVFTDASANAGISPNFYDDVQLLGNLNWSEIDSWRWGSGSENQKRQRMAEALIPNSVQVQNASKVIVWNNDVGDKVRRIVKEHGCSFPPIALESEYRRHYFTKFEDPAERGKGFTLVTGPKETWDIYSWARTEANDVTQKSRRPSFDSLTEMLETLREDFGCLPHTAELIGLRSANGMHKKTVDVHTKEVVEKLLELHEFDDLPLFARNRVELAAYLHDIGKGPKSRWTWNDGLQKVDPDHPVRAMEMMVDIFINHVACDKPEAVNSILKLVCYHDLVGEVLGKGRDKQQIVDVAHNLLELDMLFVLGRADATSLSEEWWDEDEAVELYSYCRKKIIARNQITGY